MTKHVPINATDKFKFNYEKPQTKYRLLERTCSHQNHDIELYYESMTKDAPSLDFYHQRTIERRRLFNSIQNNRCFLMRLSLQLKGITEKSKSTGNANTEHKPGLVVDSKHGSSGDRMPSFCQNAKMHAVTRYYRCRNSTNHANISMRNGQISGDYPTILSQNTISANHLQFISCHN